eukprot:gene13235-biopygen16545
MSSSETGPCYGEIDVSLCTEAPGLKNIQLEGKLARCFLVHVHTLVPLRAGRKYDSVVVAIDVLDHHFSDKSLC